MQVSCRKEIHPLEETMKVLVAALLAFGTACTGINGALAADTYPVRPIRWIVGFPAGGPTDILARIMAQWLSERLGQQFIVENRPGAGNNIGTAGRRSTRRPTATRFSWSTPPTPSTRRSTRSCRSTFCDDIVPVAGLVRVPNVMEVHPSRAGEDRCRVHRLCQGQSRQGQLRRRPATARRCTCRANCSWR